MRRGLSFLFVGGGINFAGMEMTDDLIRLHFAETLSLHGEMLADLFNEQLDKGRLKRSGDLMASVDYETGRVGESHALDISFATYGRAVDISGYRKERNRIDTNRDIWGMKEHTLKRNTAKRWYARHMYTSLYKLIARLSYGLGEDEMARLKGILENRTT